MKKLLTVTTIALSSIAVCGAALAQGFNNGSASQVNENAVVKTVSDALKANDDTPVRLEGQIVKQLGKKDFIFKDGSGQEIQIEIDKKVWNGITVNPQDQIQIIGKVDKEWNNTEIDVKQVIKK